MVFVPISFHFYFIFLFAALWHMDVFITITAINWSCVATASNLEVPYCFILHTSGVSRAKFN